MSVSVRSFAKINLGLCIGRRREDGFHDLLTVYQTIGLHDLIRIRVERGSGIEIRCADARVPCDESNTCHRVAAKVVSAFGGRGRVVIDIEKRLPVQGGLGGASSNAVATLLGLEAALKKSLSASERLRFAAGVGSDLPLFLIGGTVLGVGRGEEVYPLEDLPSTACVVVTPPVGVSTPKAFADWDRLWKSDVACGVGTPARESASYQGRTGKARPELLEGSARLHTDSTKLTLAGASDKINQLRHELAAWLSDSFSGAPLFYSGRRFRRGRAENPLLALVRTGIQNDFEQVVFPDYPELNEAKRALVRAGAKYASLSGSGSALYGLFATRVAARQAAEKLRKQGWAAQETVTLTRREYWKRIIV
jgi:4-diphosphocytidyl-2-C-methyl-D-erythritol kinase